MVLIEKATSSSSSSCWMKLSITGGTAKDESDCECNKEKKRLGKDVLSIKIDDHCLHDKRISSHT